ncbi:ABC transporter substrate-binding protein [bacterium]|nr:ABC transporter substrate-binding protein [bacterium]
MKTKSLTAILLILVIFVLGCPQTEEPEPGDATEPDTGVTTGDGEDVGIDNGAEPQVGGIYKFPLDTDPPTLDPAKVTDTVSDKVIRSIFDGLVKISPEGAYIPAIAERWEANEDGTVWTFFLKENVYFHNGRQVKAEDFEYSFLRVLNPEFGSPRTWVLDKIKGANEFLDGDAQGVEGIMVLDEFTLQITLEKPFAPFLGLMSMSSSFVVPREVADEWGDLFASEPNATVGTGPFILRTWEHNNFLLLESNPEYFAGKPYVDGLRYSIIKEPLGRLQEFRARNLHHTDIPSDLLPDVMADPDEAALMVSRPLMDVYNLGFNCEKPPFKDNPTLRRAFCHAVNREFLINTVLSGVGTEATSIVPLGIFGYDAGLTGYEYNEELAKELLDEAGYPNGDGLPEITLWFDNRPPRPDICQSVQQDFARIGVNIVLKQLEWDAFLSAVDVGEPAFFQLTWLADYPDPENFLWVLLHSDQWGPPGNGTRYKNDEFDRLIDEAGVITDQARRWELYAEAERIAFEDAPWLLLFWNECTILVAPEVRDLGITALDRPPVLPSVEIEHVWFSE